MELTPQQKKYYSLTRDRRNMYGESSHGSRKSIPRQKRFRIRRERRAANLWELDEYGDSAALAMTNGLLKRKTSWRKCPDMPLGEANVIKLELHERRAAHNANKKGK